jgi:hypothetical protein
MVAAETIERPSVGVAGALTADDVTLMEADRAVAVLRLGLPTLAATLLPVRSSWEATVSPATRALVSTQHAAVLLRLDPPDVAAAYVGLRCRRVVYVPS